MTQRKILFTAIFLGVISCANGFSQSIENFKTKLSQPDSVTLARVEIVEHGDAAAAVRQMAQSNLADAKIKGYRVRIFFDNSQNARSSAESALSRFKEFFPDVPAYMNYENPYFKVTVGNCISAEEAITLWGRVKNSFDRAFVVRETVQISTLSE